VPHDAEPKTSDARNGFLGIGHEVVFALVEAGVVWLGGTGDDVENAVPDVTGDIMHFDRRTTYEADSAELDEGLEGNPARQAWQAKLAALHTTGHVAEVKAIVDRVKARKKPSTDQERAGLEAAADKFASAANDVLQAAGA
jgi:hypothetical protein